MVLESANLETIKTKRGVELLNCDDHGKLINKMGKKLEDYRPDVTHQSLLALHDSPLNKAGLLQVFITTQKKACISVNPQLAIPRTFREFSALMAQCLTKLKVRALHGSQTLLSVVKNPVTDHLPIGIKIIGTSSKAELKTMQAYVEQFSPKGTSEWSKPICFVIGAVSVGNPGMENDYVQESICIASQGLSAACVCHKLCRAYEKHWNVV